MMSSSTSAEPDVTELTPVRFPDGRVVYAPPDDPIQALLVGNALAFHPREAVLFLFGAAAGLTAAIFLTADPRVR